MSRQTLKPTLELFGSVQSPQDSELSSGVDGLITEVAVLDGETVNVLQVVGMATVLVPLALLVRK